VTKNYEVVLHNKTHNDTSKTTEIRVKTILIKLKEIIKSLQLIKQLLKYLLHIKEYMPLSSIASFKKWSKDLEFRCSKNSPPVNPSMLSELFIIEPLYILTLKSNNPFLELLLPFTDHFSDYHYNNIYY